MGRNRIDYHKFKPGMIVGTTSTIDPLAAVIRSSEAAVEAAENPDNVNPFGRFFASAGAVVTNIFNPRTSSHILCICEEHMLIYGMEMAWPKIRQVDLCDYDGGIFGNHIVFVADPIVRAARYYNDAGYCDMDGYEWELRNRSNAFLLTSHKQSVKYDIKGLLEFWGIGDDDQRKMICSELAREMLRNIEVYYPSQWAEKVSPLDMQRHYEDTAQIIEWKK